MQLPALMKVNSNVEYIDCSEDHPNNCICLVKFSKQFPNYNHSAIEKSALSNCECLSLLNLSTPLT